MPDPASLDVVHRWVLHRASALAGEIDEAFERFRFDVAADRIYHFVWHEYADWYIELVKAELKAEQPVRDRALAVLLEVHDRVLRLLHPFVPFVTEEIWQVLPRSGAEAPPAPDERTITRSAFPESVAAWKDDDAVTVMSLIQEVTTGVRTVRSEWGVPPARKIAALVQGADSDTAAVLERHASHIAGLAGLTGLECVRDVEPSPDTVRRVVRDFQIHVPLAGIVDRAREAERVKRDADKLLRRRTGLQARLANPSFVERADPAVVDDARVQEAELAQQLAKLQEILVELDA